MQNEDMQTKDPALTKTRLDDADVNRTNKHTTDVNRTNKHTTDAHTANAHTEIDNSITENKGTDTFKEGVINSEHVNDNDNPARQPDRRDQEGNAFDEGINEHTMVGDAAKSAGINDLNRYANVDNAQTRVLNPDEKDF
ncbi:hypothetical protein [Psychrobacter immobilis]|uniref:hypothetical protein n=1 Tax=Psychrobacter immobilis TaxID=498 RepID=UPI001D0FD73C|nr:hypothetical protein [Psychrobacter immobilis]